MRWGSYVADSPAELDLSTQTPAQLAFFIFTISLSLADRYKIRIFQIGLAERLKSFT